ncbi:MAG TPA: hypothetical protein VLY82_01310 [Nitrososphaerales archaeon]|nr:hypothetical protein [Nitrososphaerales archaeon]
MVKAQLEADFETRFAFSLLAKAPSNPKSVTKNASAMKTTVQWVHVTNQSWGAMPKGMPRMKEAGEMRMTAAKVRIDNTLDLRISLRASSCLSCGAFGPASVFAIF